MRNRRPFPFAAYEGHSFPPGRASALPKHTLGSRISSLPPSPRAQGKNCSLTPARPGLGDRTQHDAQAGILRGGAWKSPCAGHAWKGKRFRKRNLCIPYFLRCYFRLSNTFGSVHPHPFDNETISSHLYQKRLEASNSKVTANETLFQQWTQNAFLKQIKFCTFSLGSAWSEEESSQKGGESEDSCQ